MLLTAAAVLNLGQQTEVFTITGSTGADTITGGSAADSISAGDGNDIINGAQNDTLLAGGNNTDTLQVGANFDDTGDAQITGIENVLLTAAAVLNLGQQTEAFTITGSTGADTITGGSAADSISAGDGNDIINGAQNDTSLAGGSNTDTLQVGANFDDINDAQIATIENVLLTAAVTLNLGAQTEGFTIAGSAGADSITAGGGNDTIVGADNDTLLAGGGGTDTLNVGANFNETSDGQIATIENILLTTAVTLDLSGQTEGFTITGSVGADSITAGGGADTIVGADNDTLLAGGGGTDTLNVGATFTSTSNAQIANIEVVTLTATGMTLNLSNQTEGFTFNGSTGIDTITGGAGVDTIDSGTGADSLTGSGGADTLIVNTGDSTASIGGSGDSGTISGYDLITDFDTASDILNLQGSAAAVANIASVNGADSALTIGGSTVKSHAITNGIVTFDDVNPFGTALSLTSLANVAAVVQYLQGNDLGSGGATVAFVANISGTAHTYIYEQVGSSPNIANDILVDLRGVTLSNLTTLISSHVTPVVLDMDHNGLQLTSLADSHAHFDFNGDGKMEHSAWVGGNDALLAYDHNGDHVVNDGSEIVFTQYHAEANTDLEGLRLAFDTNHDGVLDAKDAEFAKFGVWQDANSDGKTHPGEFHQLNEVGILSINLTSDGIAYTAAGGDVMVHGSTTFTKVDGSHGLAGDVSLAVGGPSVADLLTGDEASVEAMLPQADHDTTIHAGSVASTDASPTAADVPAVAPTVEHEPVAESAPESGAAAVAITHPIELAPVSLSEWIAPIEHAPAAVV